jgi:hypothetical protein
MEIAVEPDPAEGHGSGLADRPVIIVEPFFQFAQVNIFIPFDEDGIDLTNGQGGG